MKVLVGWHSKVSLSPETGINLQSFATRLDLARQTEVFNSKRNMYSEGTNRSRINVRSKGVENILCFFKRLIMTLAGDVDAA